MQITKTLPFFLLLFASPLAAQTCIDTDTPTSCWQKFVDPIDVAVKTADVGEMVAKTNTGAPDLSTIDNSSLRDFLSVFTAMFQKSTIEKEEDGAIVLDYNLPLDLMNSDDVIKFQAKFGKPELEAKLRTALGTNASAISTLSDSLDEADDITASASYSPTNERFGRSLAQHRTLIEGLVGGIAAKRGDDETARRLAAFANALALAPSGQRPRLNEAFTKIDDDAIRAKVVAALAAAGRSAKAQFADQEKAIVAFAELLSNQEQVYVSAFYRDRDSLAGPNAWSAKATYEFGGKNLSKFLKLNRDKCNAKALAVDAGRIDCLTAFDTYVANSNVRGWRIAASADLRQTQGNKIDLTDFSVNVSTPKSRSHIISLTAGRRLDDASSSRERRIDITGSYEDVTDDPDRDDRLVVAFTWTQELNDSITLPVTLTYANKQKYLTGVNDKLGVHFGISYKLPDLTP